MLYRVHMYGHSMTENYSGHVDVLADDVEDAVYRAKRNLTRLGGILSCWSPSMLRVTNIECIGGRSEISENRMVSLPVAPGEKLYLPGYSADGHEPVAIKTVVQWVSAYTHLITGAHFTICVEAEDLGGMIYEFSDHLIGKDFFLTREEAIKNAEQRKREKMSVPQIKE